MMDDQEAREAATVRFHAWMADHAEAAGAGWMTTSYAWTGRFRKDGVLVPFEEEGGQGFSTIPPYCLGAAAGVLEDGFVVQLLFYAAPVDRYAVVEVSWAEEPESPGAYPIGKPAPEGTAPLRWVEEGEDVPDGCMVAWDAGGVSCPLWCTTYPADALRPLEWLQEEEARERFPQLWEE
jgi:hypothetical protein